MGKGSSDRQCNNLVVVIRTLLFCLRQRPPPAIYLLQNSKKQPGTQKRRNKGTSSTAAEEAVDQEEEQPPLRPVASSSVVEEETKSKCKKNLIRKQVIIGSTPRNESTQSLSESEDKKTINTMWVGVGNKRAIAWNLHIYHTASTDRICLLMFLRQAETERRNLSQQHTEMWPFLF